MDILSQCQKLYREQDVLVQELREIETKLTPIICKSVIPESLDQTALAEISKMQIRLRDLSTHTAKWNQFFENLNMEILKNSAEYQNQLHLG